MDKINLKGTCCSGHPNCIHVLNVPLTCPKCDGAEIKPDDLTAEEVNNVIEKHAEQFGYVKAPKNELHTELELRQWLWLNHGHDCLYGDDGEMQCSKCLPHYDYKRMPLIDLIKNVFGSSGKRPLDEKELADFIKLKGQEWETIEDPIQTLNVWFARAICKEFSTPEVSDFVLKIDKALAIAYSLEELRKELKKEVERLP